MTDDPAALAAEIALHRPAERCSICHKAANGETCEECGEPWKPCLVRRLADSRADLLTAGNAMASSIFRFRASSTKTPAYHALGESEGAWRALAPSDGEDADGMA